LEGKLALSKTAQLEARWFLSFCRALAALAFPDGSMTASGLRREAARGHLVVERIAGKDYTTLANIERMRELCRVQAKVPDCGCGNVADENRFGSSETGETRKARAVLHTILSEQNGH